jgi:hypothetical protein
VVARDAGGVDVERDREGVKPEPDRVADARGLARRQVERQDVRDGLLGRGGLGDLLSTGHCDLHSSTSWLAMDGRLRDEAPVPRSRRPRVLGTY